VFIEPRYVFVLKSDRWYPYVAGRIALLQQSSNFATSSSGFAGGGGGGIVYAFNKSVNFDVGGAVIGQSFGDAEYTRAGALQGARYTFPLFPGFALKAGFSVGLGGDR